MLSAVIDGLPSALLTNPKEVLDGLLSNLTTNLTQGEFLRLMLDAGKLFAYDLQQGSVPVEGSYQNATIRGMAVLEVDFGRNIEYLRRRIYGE